MEKKVYTDKIVAFVDILGFKCLIDQSQDLDAEISKSAHQKLSYIFRLSKMNFALKYEEDKDVIEKFGYQYSGFSDSIIISVNNDVEAFEYLLTDLMVFQITCALEGVYIKGGITSGSIFHNESVAYGPALIEAYKLENSRAVYPRIIADNKTFKLCDEYSRDFFNQDFDGFHYIDYLQNGAAVVSLSEGHLLDELEQSLKSDIKRYINGYEGFRYHWIQNKIGKYVT